MTTPHEMASAPSARPDDPPAYHPFDPDPHAPRAPTPPGACDCQFHVLGSPERYPVRAGAGYRMPQATFAEARRMHGALGIERGIIVQATTYGTDHSALLDALADGGAAYRGCAVAPVLDASDADLARLDAAGVKGARFNFPKRLNLVPSPGDMARWTARLTELGWYAKIQPDTDGVLDTIALFEDLEIPVVIDHMARARVEEGPNGPVARKVRNLLRRGNVWLMLSNGYKISKAGPPWADVVPIARAFIEAAPDRVIWASDWPHPLSLTPPPNDGDLLDLLARFAPDPDERHRILVDNPAHLFGFDAIPAPARAPAAPGGAR